jgi:signal transduction histidine kinase
LLTAGAFIASADQLITPAITPYLVTCLIISLVILIPPFHSVLYFTVSYLVFYYAISLTQTNPDILISNQVNGLTITAIGLSLSIILWKSNITRIRQSKLIEKQNMELTESGLSKDKFFSIIAHDLKGPFSGIIGFSKLLQEDLELKNYQKINKHVSLIKSSAENTYKLLENLLEWSMSETGKISFNPEKISFSEIMKDKINEFSILAKAKNISVSYVHESDINVYADRNMLNTILRNLISNAIKYTLPDGKIEIKTSVVPGFAEIIISDNGIGLTDKIKDHLFKLGSNVSRKGTAKEKGTGLGLILSKEFVEKLGGKIWAENNVGGGSQFIFTLPVSVP